MDFINVKRPGDAPYLTTGHRMYLIGAQNGLFPERGEHMAKEMWGLWAPPIKVADGFWLRVDGGWLTQADGFKMLPWGASFTYTDGDLTIERCQWIPQDEEGLVLEVNVQNASSCARHVPVTLAVKSELMPVWLSDRLGQKDGADFCRREGEHVLVKDADNPWSFVIGCSAPFTLQTDATDQAPGSATQGGGVYFEMESSLTVPAGKSCRLRYTWASSSQSPSRARAALKRMSGREERLLTEKQAAYEALEGAARLTCPGAPLLEQVYRWTQYANDWVVRDVERVGCGVAAGYAEFPWWFGHDSTYILPALLMQGNEEVCKSTLRLVREASQRVNGNGRVVHEISTNGVVFYEGMTTETPQFADIVWRVYRWTGDGDFLREMYPFCRQGMEWVDSISTDGLPTGYGVSEIAGLDCVCCDTAAHAIRGYQAVAQMAEELGEKDQAQRFQALFQRTLKSFEERFWMEERGLYGDMSASKEEIIPRAQSWQISLKGFPITDVDEIEGYASCKQDKSPEEEAQRAVLIRHMQGVVEEARGMEDGARKAFELFDLGHSLLPIAYGFVNGARAGRILETCGGGLRPSRIMGGNIMPIGTGLRIQALAKAGRPEEILEAMELVADSFGKVMPGSTSEIYPDTGCFVQAWNSYATMWPFVSCVLGLEPDAAHKRVTLTPCAGRRLDGMRLENVIIGGERFDFTVSVRDGTTKVTVSAPEGWTVVQQG